MQPEKYDQAIENVGSRLSDQLNILREKAEFLIAEEFEVAKERGDAVELGEDELRLLKAYRSFKARSPSNSVFLWRTPVEWSFAVPVEFSLLVDPRECAGV